MQKQRFGFLSVLLILVFALTLLFPLTSFADTDTQATAADRLYGVDRYETAAKIAQNGWTTSDTAVLAPGMDQNLVDALTVAPLAKVNNAPILLTEGGQLNKFAAKELVDLGVKTVYIASGTGVITKPVYDELKAMGIETITLGGKDRFETATNIAQRLNNVTGVMVTTAYVFADALSVASIAASKGMPILLADGNNLPEVEAGYLTSIKDSLSHSYVLGGTPVVGDEVKNAIPGQTDRIFGVDRFATNLEVLKTFGQELNFDQAYIANGSDDHLVDALVVSALAGRSSSPVLLAEGNLGDDAQEYIASKLPATGKLVALGGESVVNQASLSVNYIKPEDFGVMQFSAVNGYSVGFSLANGKKSSDLKQIKVSLYQGDKLLASNVSTDQLLQLDTTLLSSPFNINGSFDGKDGYWEYGTFEGTVADVPTKAVIEVTFLDGAVYSVVNTHLTGDPEQLALYIPSIPDAELQEGLKHIKVDTFAASKSTSGDTIYNVNFSLLDAQVSDLESAMVLLTKGNMPLAANIGLPAIAEAQGNQLSTTFNTTRTADGNDQLWVYSKWQGAGADVPDRAIVLVTIGGQTYAVEAGLQQPTGDSN